ncbi:MULTISPECIES: MFS transporter [unclassified Microbulbifer]|uniref:MFS transporter n=1 Tax=unclassified Microbulbifer TaxID=2619833 RepID=UPI0027E51C9C|nr:MULTISPECIES: MFS transporter [unclassified Microbulbifer]
MNPVQANSGNLVLLWCCQCVATLGLMAMVPLMPLYLAQLGEGYSPVWASFALAAPAVTALVFSSRIGRACDRYGYRFMVLVSLVLFTASMSLIALSDGIVGFLLGRLLLGASGVSVTLTAFACAAGGIERRGRVLGRLQSAAACGCFTGPVIGGLLMDVWSLRPLLIATAAFSGIAALMAAMALREPACGDAKSSADGALQMAARPLPSHRSFTVYWMLAACLSQAGAMALVNTFVLFLQSRVSGDSLASATGIIHAAAWAAGMLAAPRWGRANDSGDVRHRFALAAAGCALSVGLLPLAGELWQILLLRLLQGACFTALAQSVIFALSHRASGGQGESAGLAKRYLVSGRILGPLLVAALLPWLQPDAVLVWVALLFAAAACCALKCPEVPGIEPVEEGRTRQA